MLSMVMTLAIALSVALCPRNIAADLRDLELEMPHPAKNDTYYYTNFYGDGTCFHASFKTDFNNHIEPRGAQTMEAYIVVCNKHPRCTAVDICYPVPEMPYCEQSATYYYINFFDDDSNCGKPCALAASTTTTYILGDLVSLDRRGTRFNYLMMTNSKYNHNEHRGGHGLWKPPRRIAMRIPALSL